MSSIRQLAKTKLNQSDNIIDIELPVSQRTPFIDKTKISLVVKLMAGERLLFYIILDRTPYFFKYSTLLEKWLLNSNFYIINWKTDSFDNFSQNNVRLFNHKIYRASNIPMNIETL